MASKLVKVQANSLTLLKCNECKGFLSCGPVFLRADGSSVCGRCPASPDSRREKSYEVAAQHLMFPCRFQEYGCQVPISFSLDGPHPHEQKCDYKQYHCPVTSKEQCQWMGPKDKFLEHCHKKHPQKVVINSLIQSPDLTESNMYKYLLQVLDYQFILHIKVCTKPGKIYYLVENANDSTDTGKYSYKICIPPINNLFTFEKLGQVTSEISDIAIEENPLSLSVNISDLPLTNTSHYITILIHCANSSCKTKITNFIYRDYRGWLCPTCSPPLFRCPFCSFKDLRNKCLKHEWYYCHHNSDSECRICGKQLALFENRHINVCNNNLVIEKDTWFQISPNEGKKHIVNSMVGALMCEYWLDDSKFELYVRSPLTSNMLQRYCCTVSVTDLWMKEIKMYTPKADYENDHDWYIEIDKDNLPIIENSFDICVNISERKNKIKMAIFPQVLRLTFSDCN